jgi:tetratricopeptide (TPR) repeat protein
LRINRREYKRAIQDFNTAFQHGMDEPETYYWRGLAHQLGGDIDNAILDFNIALRRDSRLKVVLRARGEAHLRKRNYDDALKDYDGFLAAYPDDPYVHYRRGMALRYLGKYEDATRALERSFQLDADRWPVRWGLLVTAFLYQGNTDRALEEANRLLARDSKKSDNFALRALVYRARKDWKAAIADYESGQALATDTFDKLWNHYGLAAAQCELGNKAEAAANLEKTIEYARGAGDRGTYPLACALALRSSIQADEMARTADMDAAFAQLKIALEKDVMSKAQLKIDFDAAALRLDKRFAELVADQ